MTNPNQMTTPRGYSILTKLDIRRIFTDHYKNFGSFPTHEKRKREIALFVLTPLILSGLLFWIFREISDSLINILLTAFSIFIGLLLNLLVLTYELFKKEGVPTEPKTQAEKTQAIIRKAVLHDIFTSVSYTILISIGMVILLLAGLINNACIKKIMAVIIYAGIVHFFMTILMVLKRIHILIEDDLSRY